MWAGRRRLASRLGASAEDKRSLGALRGTLGRSFYFVVGHRRRDAADDLLLDLHLRHAVSGGYVFNNVLLADGEGSLDLTDGLGNSVIHGGVGLVVASQPADPRLDQDHPELGVLVLAVALQVLADDHGLSGTSRI